MVPSGEGLQGMTAIEIPRTPILLPADFTYLDQKTLLVHQGAMVVRPEGDRGRVLGYTLLCTTVLGSQWPTKPISALPQDTVVSCFDCVAAHEQ
jgi:hypothetical protein